MAAMLQAQVLVVAAVAAVGFLLNLLLDLHRVAL
jgi:hypothetical protein